MNDQELNQIWDAESFPFRELRHLPILIWEAESWGIVAANDAAIHQYGYSRAELISLTVPDLLPAEDVPVWLERLSHNGGWRKGFSGIWRQRTKNGEQIHVQLLTLPFVWNAKTWQVGLVHDLTPSHEATSNLVRQEARLRALMQNSPDIFLVLELDGAIRYLSPPSGKSSGYSNDQVQKRRIFELMRPDDAHHLRDILTVLRVAKDPIGPFVYNLRRMDGSWSAFEAMVAPYSERGHGAGYVINLRPMSPRDPTRKQAGSRSAEDLRWRTMQTLESVGEIASGVAHNFNNILTVVNLYAGLLLAKESPESESSGSLREIMKAVDRASGITRQLLTFANKQMMSSQELDLNTVLREIAEKLPQFLGPRIVVEIDLQKDLPHFYGDRKMIELLLMNLATNARDFTTNGGKLVLGTSFKQITEPDVLANPEAQVGPFLCLSVADTGCGIAPENLPNIFHPFFTTKEVGEGTGLGLAAVYGIIKQHRGWIEVSSEQGKGTTFRIFLPALSKAGKVTVEPALNSMSPARKETILVVEDELAVRSVVRKILHTQGYDVIEASSGTEALSLWKDCGEQICLLLTDIIMPGGVTGWELAEQLRAQKPELKVIFTSGYSRELTTPTIGQSQGSVFLEKPFDPGMLLQAIKHTFNASIPPAASPGV